MMWVRIWHNDCFIAYHATMVLNSETRGEVEGSFCSLTLKDIQKEL